MPACTRILASLIITCAAAWCAALDPALLPNDRQWVAHLDVRALTGSKLGAWILARIEAEPEHFARLQLMTAISGIDPRKDIDSITLAGVDEQGQRAVCWLHGHFDRQRLETLVTAAEQHTTVAHRSYTLHRWTERKHGGEKHNVACLVRDDLLILGEDEAAVTEAIDVAAGTAKPLAATSALARAIPTTKAPILVAAAAGLNGWHRQGANSEMIRQVEAAAFTIREDGEQLALAGTVMAADADAAGRIRDLAQGLLAFVSFNPELNHLPAAREAIKHASLSLDQATVTMDMMVPVDTLTETLEQLRARRQQRQVQAP